jgi:hypothetical protein
MIRVTLDEKDLTELLVRGLVTCRGIAADRLVEIELALDPALALPRPQSAPRHWLVPPFRATK